MKSIPTEGYKLPKWNMGGQYRATALSYMKREGVEYVENSNGETYSLTQIESAIINGLK